MKDNVTLPPSRSDLFAVAHTRTHAHERPRLLGRTLPPHTHTHTHTQKQPGRITRTDGLCLCICIYLCPCRLCLSAVLLQLQSLMLARGFVCL
ncbi:hypothetical protein TSMEX_000707 [Taenia solium]|eukprot:TsM_000233300 transcript=TsM_000233300 gene=TsM_000233300